MTKDFMTIQLRSYSIIAVIACYQYIMLPSKARFADTHEPQPSRLCLSEMLADSASGSGFGDRLRFRACRPCVAPTMR